MDFRDIVGPTWITFDEKSGRKGAPTPRVFVAVAKISGPTIFVTNDAGATCMSSLQLLDSIDNS
jgi:xyloglucan-specific exo-beta-1,4-glucanase